MSVQPAKPALLIGYLCEEYNKKFIVSVHAIFTLCCAPFPIKFLISRLMWSVHGLRKAKGLGKGEVKHSKK